MRQVLVSEGVEDTILIGEIPYDTPYINGYGSIFVKTEQYASLYDTDKVLEIDSKGEIICHNLCDVYNDKVQLCTKYVYINFKLDLENS